MQWASINSHFASVYAGPPGAPLITGVNLTDKQLILQWSTAASGAIPTSYNVTIVTSNATLSVLVDSNGQSSYVRTVDVAESILYDITIAALNCAGANQTTHRCERDNLYMHECMCLPIDQSNALL